MTTSVRVDSKAIDAIFASFASVTEPGLAVGIAMHGKPVYRKGFGVASVELPAPLRPDIRMRVGSVSKHFSALALLLLIEEGRAGLDDPVRRYISALPDHAQLVTLRHLLQHTSGLRCGLDILVSMAGLGKPLPEKAIIDPLARQQAVNFAPGTGWNYNNSGYALIGTIIEKLADQPLGEVLRHRLFQPLGMEHTLLRLLDTDLVANSATLHVGAAEGGWVRGVFGPALGAEGGIVSTVDDMLRWLAHMRNPTVGSAHSWTAMRQSGVLHSGHATGYGLGLAIGEWRGHRLVHHAGGVVGGSAQMMALPDLGLDLILIANRAPIDHSQLAQQVLASCIEGESPVMAPVAPPPANGVFRSRTSGMVVELGTRDGHQTLSLMGTSIPVRFLPTGGIALVMDLGTAIHVPPGEIEPTIIDYVGLGGRERLERVAPPDDSAAPPLLGDYVSEEAQAEARVITDAGTVHLETRSLYGAMRYELRPIGCGLCSSTHAAPAPIGVIIESERNGFRFSTRRARGLRFDRR